MWKGVLSSSYRLSSLSLSLHLYSFFSVTRLDWGCTLPMPPTATLQWLERESMCIREKEKLGRLTTLKITTNELIMKQI